MSPSPGHKTIFPHWRPLRLAPTVLMAIATILVVGSVRARPVPSAAQRAYKVGESVAQQVDLLLEQARAARIAGRLVTPPGANAAALYAEVLKLDPGNVEAKDAIIDLRQMIHSSLAATHEQSPELQQLNALAMKLSAHQGIGGATATASHADNSLPPPVEHPSPPPAGQASPPPDAHVAPPPSPQHAKPAVEHALPPPAGQASPPPAAHAALPPSTQGATPPVAPSEIDQLIQSMPIGNIVFNTPQAMGVNQPQTIELVLSGAATVDELRKQITASGPLTSDRIKISDELDVHLTGTTFQIQAVTPESQAVGVTHTSHWAWQVTPTRRGAQELHLTVNAILRIDGVDREVSIKTYDRTISVNVDWPGSLYAFFAANWQWLWTAVFVPVALLGWRRFRKKRESTKA